MAAYKGDVYGDVKGIGIREAKVPDEAFGMDVLSAKKEVLSLLRHMGHVIIGAVSAAADEDILGTRWRVKPVSHIAEGPELILEVDGLDKCGRIGMPLQVIEGIQVHAVEAFCRMPF